MGARTQAQRGTGFDDYAADLRLVKPLDHGELVLASYGYVQTDAPRTDTDSITSG